MKSVDLSRAFLHQLSQLLLFIFYLMADACLQAFKKWNFWSYLPKYLATVFHSILALQISTLTFFPFDLKIY